MFRGEVYGYTHYLHLNFIQPNRVKFLWQDVVCKYWPWAQRVASEKEKMALVNTKPALSLMHGKSHSWSCQVISLVVFVFARYHIRYFESNIGTVVIIGQSQIYQIMVLFFV
jgi:hypothetical protein